LECFDAAAGEFLGSFVLTSASRSTLTGTYTGHLTGSIDQNTVGYAFDAAIEGGTGRFAGSTGSFSGAGQVNLATSQQSQSFSGSLSVPNPGKP
jgi:hypothetical protein